MSRRVDRILSETAVRAKPGLAKRLLLVASVAPVVALVAGCSVARPESRSTAAVRLEAAGAKSSTTSRSSTHNQIIQHPDDSDDPFAIVSGDSMTMNGSTRDIRRANAKEQNPGRLYLVRSAT